MMLQIHRGVISGLQSGQHPRMFDLEANLKDDDEHRSDSHVRPAQWSTGETWPDPHHLEDLEHNG
jgi:hypothetical protein